MFTISPPKRWKAPKNKLSLKNKENEIEEVSELSLAPFAAKPIICFENVPVRQIMIKKLLIKNPGPKDIEVRLIELPTELNISVNWLQNIIPSMSEILLEISWCPKEPGCWREILIIEDGKRIKREVPVILKTAVLKACRKITKKPTTSTNIKKSGNKPSTYETNNYTDSLQPKRNPFILVTPSTDNYITTTIFSEKTYVKDSHSFANTSNIMSETYTKNLTNFTYTKELSHAESVSRNSSEIFDDSLELINNSPAKDSSARDLLSNFSTISQLSHSIKTPFKRKSSTELVSPVEKKKANVWIADELPDKREEIFKRWLNVLLRPPKELNVEETDQPIDVAKLWQECKFSEVPGQHVSSKKQKSDWLDLIRRNAKSFYRSEGFEKRLEKTFLAVDKGEIIIRPDKNIHLDLGLQSVVISLLFSYNPLWLRIGLETIYRTTIEMSSNSDIAKLSKFICERFFKNPILLKRHKTLYANGYSVAVKKHVLRKFLSLVYFLDHAKQKKLISHNPRLFLKSAVVRDSCQILLAFAKELISATVGDVTKFLLTYGYVVSYKQTYLDEFDYTIRCLMDDLKDGIRLVRAIEIILAKDGYSAKLRVPAYSRLQKVYNVKVAFDALIDNSFIIKHGIEPKDVVEGNKVKTLSLLQQILDIFEAPRVEKATLSIQKWWRSLPIALKRRAILRQKIRLQQAAEFERKTDAAIKIQAAMRAFVCRKRFLKLKTTAIALEERYVAARAAKRERIAFQILRSSVINVQRRFRANKAMKIERKSFLRTRGFVLNVQKYVRGFLARKFFEERKKQIAAAISLQRHIRGLLTRRLYKKLLESHKRRVAAAITIQKHFRGCLGRNRFEKELLRFRERQAAALIIQKHFRGRSARKQFNKLMELHRIQTSAAVTIQKHFRGYVARKFVENHRQRIAGAVTIQKYLRGYLTRKVFKKQLELHRKQTAAAVIVQKYVRGHLTRQLFKKLLESHKKRVAAAVTIQKHLRGCLAKKRFKIKLAFHRRQQAAAIIIQKHFRGRSARKQFKRAIELHRMRTSMAVTIQKHFRGHMARKRFEKLVENFRQRVAAAVTIQKHFRSYLARKFFKKELECHRKRIAAAIIIQKRFRGYSARKQFRKRIECYRKQIAAAIAVQKHIRGCLARKLFKQKLANFRKQTAAAVIIQKYIRGHLAREAFVKRMEIHKKRVAAAIAIQKCFRGYVARKRFKIEMENHKKRTGAAVKIQKHVRGYLARKLFEKMVAYHEKKIAAAITIQKHLRGRFAREHFKEKVKRFREQTAAAVAIQKHFRGRLGRKRFKTEMRLREEQIAAAITIQKYARGRIARNNFKRELELRKKLTAACLTIQKHFRGHAARKRFKKQKEYLEKRISAAVAIQKRFRGQLARKHFRAKLENHKKQTAAAVVIQKRFRWYLAKKETENRKKLAAAVTLQKHLRGCLARKRLEEELARCRLFKRQNDAASKIQALWRGFKWRKDHPEFKKVLNSVLKANSRAVPENTLAFKRDWAVQTLLDEKATLQTIIQAVENLDFVIRRCRDTCVSLSKVFPEQLYILLTTSNRSPADVILCTFTTSILISFAKYPKTKQASWMSKHIDALINLMKNSCDKEDHLFLYLCTLLWLFAHDRTYKDFIKSLPNLRIRLEKIKSLCVRKEKMWKLNVKKNTPLMFQSVSHPCFPSLKPDWGAESRRRPRTFENSVHAIKCVMNILDMK